MEQLKTFYKNYRSAIKKTIATHKAHKGLAEVSQPVCLQTSPSLTQSLEMI